MIIRSSLLNDLEGVSHAFFSRLGGVSSGSYHSLNCGYGSRDEREAVTENRCRAMAMLGLPAKALVTCYQVHGVQVSTISDENSLTGEVHADALVTDQRGIALGVLTADCAPVILVDIGSGVIGAIHAGWRGAFAGVLEAGTKAMITLGARAELIRASIGPCIGPGSYEVGPEFLDRFIERDCDAERCFRPAQRSGYYFFDLATYVETRLTACGISAIDRCDVDTYIDSAHFFSFRRSQHHGEPDYGRGLSAVALR